MATTIKAMAATAALALLALPTTGDAQSGASRQPIAFGADEGEYTTTGASLRGRAEVVQGGRRIGLFAEGKSPVEEGKGIE